ncbi:UNVERIFIED_CONTAM: Sulfite exporter TauE/SafE family protein 3 [Sesamum latifolium]|uniref:Sulfite exporter TauE/SafE family protein 3 n=1 Tax=Sesamum latifolium TaxID=2727402 RepID=A0AAW2UDN2_9LAMI
MAEIGKVLVLSGLLVLACAVVTAQEGLEQDISRRDGVGENLVSGYFTTRIISFLQQSRDIVFRHVWPDMEFGWRIVLGTVIGFFGAALGSVGGVGGGGIFVPMLTLIIGFDPKTSTAVSKCMITGAAVATVYYNLKLRHPSLDLPVIDYDLALLFQPMLVLGISIGVIFNVIFAEWMVTVLLIILFIGTSLKAFFKGVETWKKETIIMKEAARRLLSDSSDNGSEEAPYKLLPDGPTNETRLRLNENKAPETRRSQSLIMSTGRSSASLLLSGSSSSYYTSPRTIQPLVLQHWTVTLLQIPVAVGASGYQAVCLYKGWRVVESKGGAGISWRVHQLILCCCCGILAGIVGGLLGLGGGFIIGPLLLELGIPPQVSSATATLIMTFSSSMSVIQYYLLRRFPPSYALYFVLVATVAALVGQHVVRKMVSILRRASFIIFILAFTIFVSAISLGWVGISNIIGEENIWFYNICEYKA